LPSGVRPPPSCAAVNAGLVGLSCREAQSTLSFRDTRDARGPGIQTHALSRFLVSRFAPSVRPGMTRMTTPPAPGKSCVADCGRYCDRRARAHSRRA
jgi:hypothetical protein